MGDDTFKLVLDLANSSATVAELVAKLGELKGKTEAVADTYALVDKTLDQYNVELAQTSHAVDAQVAEAVRLTQAQRALRASLEETEAPLQRIGGFTKANSQRILEWGRATQDFAQGGFAGIVNNIERMVGGAGPLAGILTAVGTAAFVAKPFIESWAKSLVFAGEKIPEATDAIGKFSEAIKKNKKEIEDLKEKQVLTYIELLKYKDLIGETTRLEEEQARARDARVVGPNSDKKSRERSSAVRETIAEKFETSQELIDKIMATEQGQQVGLKRVEEMLAGAQKGNGLDITSLKNTSPAFKEAYEPFSPEGKAQAKQAQDNLKKEQEILGKREKELAAKDKLDADIAKTQQNAKNEAEAGRKQDIKNGARKFVNRAKIREMGQKGRAEERKGIDKRREAAQDKQQIRGIQNEAAGNGWTMTAQQANQILQQRKSEQKQLEQAEAQAMNSILQGQGSLASQIQMWKQVNAQAVQSNRSQASNGNN